MKSIANKNWPPRTPPSPKEDASLKETLAEAAPTASNQKGNAPSSMEGRGTESVENALLAEMKKDEEISKAQDSKLIDQGWSEYQENTLKEDKRLEAQLRKLAQGANPEAATLLGVAGYYGRLARKQEEKKTLTYLLLGADGGCPEAFALLAEVFYKQKDFAKARSYAEKAQQADQGLGYLYLGVLAGSGEGEPLDIEKAKACFLKARDKGLPRASFCLGLYYWLSPSVKQDADQALFYYKEAAERG
jgi:TPR repeat protein